MERSNQISANEFYSYLSGSDHINRYFPNHYITEGVQDVVTKEECFWFLDIILSYQIYNKIGQINKQYWLLERTIGNEFLVTAKDENENILVKQKIPFSDFFFKKFELRLFEKIIYLPSEE
ncbi:DUF6876 family protein [Chryseobacterium sp. SL1]|uniref:DUF6876 family protein n=1 Tax=Chryseobacterium sp. SL1 TaxID=2995159 RepID=UPI0022765B1F|nr:DUF6876 family protein [Chryseobacterium sp. SL1]MCY1659322.1 hypothetical protein [Chryseobacterium sp. SL1]